MTKRRQGRDQADTLTSAESFLNVVVPGTSRILVSFKESFCDVVVVVVVVGTPTHAFSMLDFVYNLI